MPLHTDLEDSHIGAERMRIRQEGLACFTALFSYITFARRNVRLMLFGVVLMTLSSPGQTYFISLFASDFITYFHMTEGDLSTIFSAATIAAAVALPVVGGQLDRSSLAAFTLGVGATSCVAPILLGFGPPWPILLAACLFLLRLAGQGLMVHTAMTVITRTFPRDSGKAFAVVSLFNSLALLIIPATTVSAIEALGWQFTWRIVGTAVAGGTALALALLTTDARSRRQRDHSSDRAASLSPQPPQVRPSLGWMLLICPPMLTVSFVFTGLLFNQVILAGEKGWSMAWLGGCYSIFALAQAVTSIAGGPLVDAMRPIRILPVFLVPLAVALCLVAVTDAAWVAPTYMGLIGVSAALDLKLGTILWGEVYGPGHIGYVRSRFEAIRIVVTGSAPLVMGQLLAYGVSLTRQAGLYCLLTSLMCVFAMILCRHVPGVEADESIR